MCLFFFSQEWSQVQCFWFVQERRQQELRQQGWVTITALRCAQDKPIASSLSLTHLFFASFYAYHAVTEMLPKSLMGKDSVLSSARQM